MASYSSNQEEIDPAKKLFWENMMANAKSTSTKIRAIVQPVADKVDKIEGIARLLASVFKVGGNDAEKVYPSKKK
jgi:hypothetical protein